MARAARTALAVTLVVLTVGQVPAQFGSPQTPTPENSDTPAATSSPASTTPLRTILSNPQHSESASTAPGNAAQEARTPIRRSNSAASSEDRRSGQPSIWHSLGMLGLVLAGIVVAARLYRRYAQGGGSAAPEAGVHLLGSRRLDAQSTVHLIRIGRRVLAVGAGPSSMTTLAVIDDPQEVEQLLGEGGPPQRSAAPPFRPGRLFNGSRSVRRDQAAPLQAAGTTELDRPAPEVVGEPIEQPEDWHA